VRIVRAVDLFPIRLTKDGTTWRKARLYSRDGRVRVWTADAGRVELLVDSTEAVVEPNGKAKHWTLTTPDGVYDVVSSGGCGCSSPLKRLNPARQP
jgi:hypothetical protein